jgi:CspA family cold shock protein
MLEAIKRFLERGRASRRGQHQAVEEVGSIQPLDNSEAPSPSTEPQIEEPSDPPVPGKVKWFNPEKRYGFVELADGSGDAFLHASALERLGIEAVQPGETLDLRVAQGQRGLQVTEVLGVDTSTRISFESPLPGSGSSAAEASIEETGTVKWYSVAKRFGFIVRDEGGKDIFVHASVLQRAGIESLSPGQRVTVGIIEGRKGPEATAIRFA